MCSVFDIEVQCAQSNAVLQSPTPIPFYFTNWQYAVTFSGILLLVAGAASVLYFLVEKPTANLVGQLQGALTGGGRGRRRRSAQQEAMNMASGAGYAPINADGHERGGDVGGEQLLLHPRPL